MAADALPQDIAFHPHSTDSFQKALKQASARLFKVANSLTAYAATHSLASAWTLGYICVIKHVQ